MAAASRTLRAARNPPLRSWSNSRKRRSIGSPRVVSWHWSRRNWRNRRRVAGKAVFNNGGMRVLAALLLCGVAHAQPAKPVELYIGYSVGGGYDVYARLLARHMGRHLPGNPVIVPKNMEGAGSLRLANWLYKAAPRDGSAFGTIGRGIAFDPLLGTEGAQFKASEFGWIGSMNDEVSVCAAWG